MRVAVACLAVGWCFGLSILSVLVDVDDVEREVEAVGAAAWWHLNIAS